MSERIITTARINVRPCLRDGEPLKVRKPVGGYLASEGEAVNDETYWRRRLAERDVELFEPEQPPNAGAKAGK